MTKYRDAPPSYSRVEVLWDLSKKGDIWWGVKFLKAMEVLIPDILAAGTIMYDQVHSYGTESGDVALINN